MIKSPNDKINFQISKLDLKNIPAWLRDRFDSILSNSETGDFVSLADELSRNISKISLADGNSFEYSDVKSMLAIDTTDPEIGIISSGSNGNLVISEFGEEQSLVGCGEVKETASPSEKLGSLVSIAWDVAGIIWNDNCNLHGGKFSIQSTLM